VGETNEARGDLSLSAPARVSLLSVEAFIGLTYLHNTTYVCQCKPNYENIATFLLAVVGLRLVRLRQKLEGLAELRGWSIRKVAQTAKVNQQTLLGAMNGHNLGVSYAIAVAGALDVPVEWLFDDKQGWEDLVHKPYWLEPGIKPGQALGARRRFEKTLAEGPPGAAGTAARKRKKKPSRQAKPAQAEAGTGRRRKSGT